MNGYFVTGTDTGVGKTLVAAVLTLALEGYYWKPVQSGIRDEPSDKTTIQQLTDLSDEHFFASNYALQANLAPNQAAARENITIDLQACKLDAPRYPLIVEGAGGVCVPLNDKDSMLDLIHQTALPVIIASRGTLGTINHTLLTINMLQQKNIPIEGVVFSGELNMENKKHIEDLSGVKTLFHIPLFAEVSKNIFQKWVELNRDRILEALPCL
jgi:dethiobiotin synthase